MGVSRRTGLDRQTSGHAPAAGRRRLPVAAGVATMGVGRETKPEHDRASLSVAILDRDSGFQMVLINRMQRLGWRHRMLSSRAGAKAIAAAQAQVLIVDLAILGARRWTWLARVREQCPEVRVLVCTGASTVAERVCALRMGADDWLTKPCHPEEMIARVEAITACRRRPEQRDLEPLKVGEVEIRPDQFQAFVGEASLRLTRREYQLIELLARAGGEVLTRETIYDSLWGGQMLRNDRSVDVFVHKLRRKLERASPSWHYVHTDFGIGYRLAAELRDGGEVRELPLVGGERPASLAA
jgi:DNA-binding response OmpR family regulator